MAANNGPVPSNGVYSNGSLPGPVVQLERQDGPMAALLLDELMPKFRTGYVKVGADEFVMPENYRKFAKRLETFETRLDDVFVASHPKAGTTWTQEMVWCIVNDLDFVGAERILSERFPFLEIEMLFDFSDSVIRSPKMVLPHCVMDSLSFVEKLESPRFIKTHLPWDLLPGEIRNGVKQPKIVYVARNPKDTCLSYYHHSVMFAGYKGTFEQFANLFLAGMPLFSPYWKHVLSYWKRRHLDNILFIKYEEMKRDLGSVIRKTADFLGKTLSGEQVTRLEQHLSFASMSKNLSINQDLTIEIMKNHGFKCADGNFMRKGQVGEGKEAMSAEMAAKFDKLTSEHLQGTGLTL